MSIDVVMHEVPRWGPIALRPCSGNKATFNRDIFISSFLIWVLHDFANKGPSSQIFGFSNSHIQL